MPTKVKVAWMCLLATFCPAYCDINGNTAMQIASDVFYNYFGITFVWFGIHIETFFVFPVAESIHFFLGWADLCLHLIKQCGPESVAEIGIVEIIDIAQETVITVTVFRDETIKQCPVIKEKLPEVFVDGKNTILL